MAVEYICDGCGRKAKARFNYHNDPINPSGWQIRADEDFVQHACSNECVELSQVRLDQPAKVNHEPTSRQ